MVVPASSPNSNIFVFDHDVMRNKRDRCAPRFADHNFLFDWSGKQLLDRLSDIKRDYPRALVLGMRQGAGFFDALMGDERIGTISASDVSTAFLDRAPAGIEAVQAHEEMLPFEKQSYEMILCNLGLHGLNDLPGALVQMRNTLKPDGLFMASMLGGESLHELKTSLMEAELEISGGISPRVAPFADKQDMGALMQRAGYALPVIDSERVIVTYENAFKLFSDLRGMGETNSLTQRSKTIPPRALFFRAAEIYAEKFAERDGRIAATFEIIFLLGWAPHESQQKPLKPGSAQTRLADALGTEEVKTPD